MITATNDSVVLERSITVSGKLEAVDVRNDSQLRARAQYFFSPHDIIGIELSLVPEVQCVFVDREEDARSFRVTALLKNSNPEIRNRVYDRELEIIDQLPYADISFHLFELRGRKSSDIMTDGGKIVFQRR